ncbi:MAG TPA: serine hydrolase [Acidimicrobiales bacterium]|nr:serine hydrolase [Acidimicrobiales bacterium]
MSARRRLRLARTGLVALALGVGGYALGDGPGAPVTLPTKRAHGTGSTDSATAGLGSKRPVLAGASGEPASPLPPADIFDVPAIAAFLDAEQSLDLTAAVYDADTGATWLYRRGVVEEEASIMKVDILSTLLAESQSSGQDLTAQQTALCQQMIEESYNDDAQDLWDALGGASSVAAYNQDAGVSGTTPDAAGYWGLSTTTAADQVLLLERIAYPNAVLNDASRAYAMSLMTNVDPAQAWGVSAGVPAGVTVAIKNGWLPLDQGGWQVSSVGIMQGDGRDYAIAVLTNQATTEQQGIDAIEGLSALVWQELAPSAGT